MTLKKDWGVGWGVTCMLSSLHRSYRERERRRDTTAPELTEVHKLKCTEHAQSKACALSSPNWIVFQRHGICSFEEMNTPKRDHQLTVSRTKGAEMFQFLKAKNMRYHPKNNFDPHSLGEDGRRKRLRGL